MTELRQLGLPFTHRPRFGQATFLEGPSNAEAIAWLARTGEWPGGRLALWGEAGCGKTHMLHLWAEHAGGRVLLPPLVGMAPPDAPWALDDAEATLADERRLLHWLNAAAEARHPVLLASRAPPARWNVALADLESRLRATASVEVGAPDETLLATMLASLLAERQVAVAPAVQAWLLRRLARTPAAVRDAVERLDRAALATGGGVNRAIAAKVLAEMEEPDGRDRAV